MCLRRKAPVVISWIGLALVALLPVLGSPVIAVAQGAQPSVTNLTINPDPATLGQTVVFSAKVAGVTGDMGLIPTGTVTFYNGSTQLATATLDSNGVGTFSTSSLAIGLYFITAAYGGDSNFASSTSSLVLLTVYQGGANTSTSTSLTIQPDPGDMGQTFTFSARVSGGTGALGQVSGSMTFYNGTTQMAVMPVDNSGLATYSSSSFDVGTYSITAAYSGDSKYQPSNSPAVPLQVNLPGTLTPTTTTVTSSNSNSDFGSTVIFFANVGGGIGGSHPTGTVTFLDGTTTLGTGTLLNGAASYSTSTLSIGTHSITAQYSGDADFAASTSSVFTQTVSFSSGSSTFIVNVNPSALTLSQGSSGSIVVTVLPAGGFNQQISFTCSGLPIYTTCSFSPATVSPDGSNTSLTSNLTIKTNVGSSWLSPGNLPFGRSLPSELATIVSPVLFGVFGIGAARRGRRRGRRGMTRAALFLAGLCVLMSVWFVACGGSGTKRTTPSGNSTVTVVGSSASQGQSTTFSLTVQ